MDSPEPGFFRVQAAVNQRASTLVPTQGAESEPLDALGLNTLRSRPPQRERKKGGAGGVRRGGEGKLCLAREAPVARVIL